MVGVRAANYDVSRPVATDETGQQPVFITPEFEAYLNELRLDLVGLDAFIETGTVENAIANWDNAAERWRQLPDVTMDHVNDAFVLSVREGASGFQPVIIANAAGVLQLHYAGTHAANIDDADGNGVSVNVFGANPSIQFWEDDTYTTQYMLMRRSSVGNAINFVARNPGDNWRVRTRRFNNIGDVTHFECFTESALSANDEYIGINFNGSPAFRSSRSGLRLEPRAGDVPASELGDGQIWYDTTGMDRYRCREGGENVTLVTRTTGSFTPTVSFATPGDLTVSYSSQIGYYWRDGPLVHFRLEVIFTPTHTTAAGNFRVNGLPYAVDTTNGGAPIWEVQITKPNDGWGTPLGSYVMVKAFGTNDQTYIQMFSDGENQSSMPWTITEFGTGNLVGVLRIYGHYETDEAI